MILCRFVGGFRDGATILVPEHGYRFSTVRCIKTRWRLIRDWETLPAGPGMFIEHIYERQPGTDVATFVESSLLGGLAVRFDPRRLV